MSNPHEEEQVRRRAELIVKVRAGLLTAVDAARQLGVSRKTYYKWEQRGLAAMMEGISDREPGRPTAEPDPPTEPLERRVRELEQELQRRDRREALRNMLKDASGKKG